MNISTPQKEGVLQVSKSLKYQVLLDDKEMQRLFAALGEFYLGIVSEPNSLESLLLDRELFLEKYQEYISALKRGELALESGLRKYFSVAMSKELEAFYAMDVGRERFLLKTIKPVIQLQAHHFLYSSVDEKFHPLVLGRESITWGLQFSYPQISADPKTHAISKIESGAPNSVLFKQLTEWLREHTRPTPFIVGTRQSNEPIRIGKECFQWIAKHPQLKIKGIFIRGAHGN